MGKKYCRIALLCFAFVAFVVMPIAAQAQSENNQPQPGTAVELNTLEGPTHVEFLTERFQQFAEKTGIRVNLNVIPYGRDATMKLVASFMTGGDQYDVFVIDCVDVARYASAGWVYPIDDLIPDSYKEDILPFAQEGMMYQGKWYGLPWGSEWKSFIYNSKMLKETGRSEFPKTWADVVSYSHESCLPETPNENLVVSFT